MPAVQRQSSVTGRIAGRRPPNSPHSPQIGPNSPQSPKRGSHHAYGVCPCSCSRSGRSSTHTGEPRPCVGDISEHQRCVADFHAVTGRETGARTLKAPGQQSAVGPWECSAPSALHRRVFDDPLTPSRAWGLSLN